MLRTSHGGLSALLSAAATKPRLAASPSGARLLQIVHRTAAAPSAAPAPARFLAGSPAVLTRLGAATGVQRSLLFGGAMRRQDFHSCSAVMDQSSSQGKPRSWVSPDAVPKGSAGLSAKLPSGSSTHAAHAPTMPAGRAGLSVHARSWGWNLCTSMLEWVVGAGQGVLFAHVVCGLPVPHCPRERVCMKTPLSAPPHAPPPRPHCPSTHPGESLKKYAVDLTERAKAGKVDPVIGREEVSGPWQRSPSAHQPIPWHAFPCWACSPRRV
jgi:hypothetical protein